MFIQFKKKLGMLSVWFGFTWRLDLHINILFRWPFDLLSSKFPSFYFLEFGYLQIHVALIIVWGTIFLDQAVDIMRWLMSLQNLEQTPFSLFHGHLFDVQPMLPRTWFYTIRATKIGTKNITFVGRDSLGIGLFVSLSWFGIHLLGMWYTGDSF